jgi:dTDP-4-amino-4,6-dideoxygalactose transaminase
VEAKVHYPVPLHLQKPGREMGYEPGDMPVAEVQADRLITLPAHEYLTDPEVFRAAGTVKGCLWEALW